MDLESPARATAGAIALPLVAGAAFALPAALLLQLGLPAAAAWAAFGLLVTHWRRQRWRLAGLCALPVVLAGVPQRQTPVVWPRPGPVRVAGTVAEVVRAPTQAVTWITLQGGAPPVRLQFEADVEVLPGDRLHAVARLGSPVAPDLAPTLHAAVATVVVQPGPWSLPRAAAALRRLLERQLLQRIPDERGALLASLLLGRGTRCDAALAQAHRATGLSHLLAVSGAHAAMLALLLGLVGRGQRLAAGPRRTLVVLALLFAYAAITGNEPPVVRAVATFALAALATHTGRPFPLRTGLLAPAVATCLWQPEALLGPSFLLSYAAVIGLALAGPPRGEPGLRRWFVASCRGSCWATLLTAPLTLWFFGQLAPWTVLLTPLLSPLVALLLFGSLACAVLGLCAPALGALLALPLQAATSLYVQIVVLADALPGTPVAAWAAPAAWLLGLAAGLAVVAVLCWPDRRGAALGSSALIAPHFLPLHAPAAPSLSLFAVGHGQACLYRGADHNLVVDCGSLQVPRHAARSVLLALARRHVDLLVVSHADQDHHNGIGELLRAVPIDRAVLPARLADSDLRAVLRAHGTSVQLLHPGEHSEPLPGVVIAAPAVPPLAGDNDHSLWTRLTVGTAAVLLTGDAEALGTAAALAQGLAAPADVLLLPHHGRPNPTAALLLARVRPRVCLASAAADDGETALGRVARAFGADLWVTGRHGTVELVGGDPPRVRPAGDGRPLPPRGP
ncbi:MAG: ComEC/Rec2 family competence protein [Planctomycetes bacterium]|nr:ComEC/Rec2 family competence protein [Planctomycetota bacterium]